MNLYLGDSLELLKALDAASVDAIVTDPPYSITSEASSTVSRAERNVRETQFFEAWLREQLTEMVRVLKPTGAMWMTLDWRGAMVLDAACAKLNLREPKIGVWDKEHFGLGGVLRNQYECFAIVPMADWQKKRADVPDVWRHRWTQGGRETTHKAEKPVDLMRRACDLLAPEGGLILDPYMGGGTTGKAALQGGYRFIGFERDPAIFAMAWDRLAGVPK